jgi:glycosyltransferase involved in cell wall biosynthesis
LNQTYENLEIILVDDGSPDRCPEICDLYASKDPRIKVIHKENGGLVSARKAGLLGASGRYVGYVDGDDWVGEGFVESLYTAISTADADIACGGFSRDLFSRTAHFTDNMPCGVYEGERLEDLRCKMVSFGDFFKIGVSTYVWNKLFRREILLDAQLPVDNAISIGEDAAVTYPAIIQAKRVVITDTCAYHYRQREDSMLKKVASFSSDALKLKYLYEYMSKFAGSQDEKYKLQSQVDDFVLGICMMRSGSLSCFGNEIQGKNLAIYSAGTFGQQLYNKLHQSANCTLVNWVDDDYWEYRRCCLDVNPVESLSRGGFDYVLIATLNDVLKEKIASRLMDCGVNKSKILTVTSPNNRHERIQQYLYNAD